MNRTANFDRLARAYRGLEYLAFGRDLERTRFRFLDELRACDAILVLGEGDGRCLARLVAIAPEARIHCVDASATMAATAAQRLSERQRERVTFTVGDARTVPLAIDRRFDAVVTFFFLDCFSDADVAALVARVQAQLQPRARWLFADFMLPPRGLARLRARTWLGVLYTFFRWQTRLAARALPDSAAALELAGFRRTKHRDLQLGLLTTAVYVRDETSG